MKKKQIIAILAIFMFLNVASLTFVTAKPNKISRNLEEDLARLDAGSINVLIETYSHDYASIISEIESLGGIITNQFKYASGLAAEVPINAIFEVNNHPNIKKISKDGLRYLTSVPVNLVEKPLDDFMHERITLSGDGENYEVKSMTLEEIEIFSSLIDPNTYWNYLSMGAIDVWNAGNMGEDSLAVIIDTGVYAEHVMLGWDPVGPVIGGVDLTSDVGTPYEGFNNPNNHWHGTHCAGILAGAAVIYVTDDDILYQSFYQHTGLSIPASDFGGDEDEFAIPLFGMAPMAEIYGIKVFDHTGAGVPESEIIAAIEYAIDMHESGDYDVDIISMSLGGGTGFDGRDLEDQTVDYATSIGITVVTSAGNDGPASITTGSPGTANTAIAVGAVANPINTRVFWDWNYGWLDAGYYLFTSDTSQIIYFSSRGPTSDGRLKPTLSATGVFVMSAFTPEPGEDPPGTNDVGWASGTSMACPAVAGAVALLNSWGEGEGASPYDYKQALVDGAVWLDGYKEYEQGAGNLNAWNSYNSLLNDPLLGEAHPGLNNGYSRKPVTPEGINTHINGKGTFSYTVENLEPGHGFTFYLKASELTDYIKIDISDVELNVDPVLFNSFELSVQSAVRSSLDYYVDSANVWGSATFEIEDYSTTWTYDNTYGVFYEENPIQPGYIQITLENDWTSFDVLSGTIEITVEQDRPFWSNGKKAPKPDVEYSGFIETGEALFWYPMGPSKVIELWWKNDWTGYPTTDLDMVIAWFNATGDLFYESIAGGSLRSPEGVYLPDAVASYVLIFGYETYGVAEPWKLYGYYH